MKHVGRAALFLALAVGMADTRSASAMQEPVCVIEDHRLVCGDGPRDRAVLAQAMGNPKSLALLNNLRGTTLFEGGGRRERFRRSLEKNRAALVSHAARMFRLHQKGRISDDERAAVKGWLDNGMKVYARGLYLYREVTWQREKLSRYSEAPDRPPPVEEPTESEPVPAGDETRVRTH